MPTPPLFSPPLYVSGDWVNPKAVSGMTFDNPIPGDNTDYVMTQDFVQFLDNYIAGTGAIALNAAHPHAALSGFLFCGVSNKQDIGGGAIRWTRTYAKIPPSWNDAATIAYGFPGYLYDNGDFWEGRNPFMEGVNARVHNEYFLVGTGGTYATAKDIPVLQQFEFTTREGTGFPTQILGGVTIPTKNVYIADYIGKSKEILAENSRLTRWNGNIWLRSSSYVIAI